ncbi:hypothetical protein [Cupriavidus sp. a3]|uniref:hypothetical protein n=1 Tax=Cupriavidus sp. a3 TaxID=3242158 RepID=UPI003D9C0F2F
MFNVLVHFLLAGDTFNAEAFKHLRGASELMLERDRKGAISDWVEVARARDQAVLDPLISRPILSLSAVHHRAAIQVETVAC